MAKVGEFTEAAVSDLVGEHMKYVRNTLMIIVVCFVLQYFDIVNFRQLMTIDRALIISTLLPCTLMLLMVNSLAAIRWVLVVNRFLGSRIDLMAGMSVTFKSGLFAYFLPGQLGSELGRVLLASRGKSSNDRNHAVTSAIIDRVMALVSMLIMSVVFLAWAFLRRYDGLTILAALAGCVMLAAVFVPLGTKLLRSFVFALKKNRYVDYFGNILKMVKTFVMAQRLFCCSMLLYSMLLNLAVAFVTYLIVSRIIYPLDFSTVALMSLVSNLSSVIPITPGGVGISEVVFRETGTLVQALSVNNLAGGYILFRLLNITSFIVGMVFLEAARLGQQKRKSQSSTY